MPSTERVPVAILGSGNIGTDLMIKILRTSRTLRMAAMVGVDPESEGLARARRLGVATTSAGLDGFLEMPEFAEVRLVFDATSAAAHRHHDSVLRAHRKTLIDLTPAAVGPFVIPPVNGDQHLDAPNLNMVTCGGQATIPIVAAVGKVTPVLYAEIVASIASRSAGPGTRANIDEFTETTARAIEQVGGARHGKAIIVLNPAEPPLVMRDTVYCLTAVADEQAIEAAVQDMVSEVQSYVPGYRLKQRVQFERVGPGIALPGVDPAFVGLKVSVFLEVEGAAHYLPAYAGNLDIMTSAALRTAERVASRFREELAA
jgi:acetaldehyde dehydrogenase